MFELGWTTSAVYQVLAEAGATIEGPAAAEKLLANALADAKAENALISAEDRSTDLDVQAKVKGVDSAIDEAQVGLPTQRRTELAKLLQERNAGRNFAKCFAPWSPHKKPPT